MIDTQEKLNSPVAEIAPQSSLLRPPSRGERIKTWFGRARERLRNDVTDNDAPRTLETAGIGILSGASSENIPSTKK